MDQDLVEKARSVQKALADIDLQPLRDFWMRAEKRISDPADVRMILTNIDW